MQSRVGGRRSAAERSSRGQYISASVEDGVVLLEGPGQWHEQRGGTADKDVSDRKKAADGCGIVREKKQPSRRRKEARGWRQASILVVLALAVWPRYEYAENNL